MENENSLIGKKIKGFYFDFLHYLKYFREMDKYIGSIGEVINERIQDDIITVSYSDGYMWSYPRSEAFKNLVDDNKENEPPKYEGEIKGIKQEEPFYMVVVEGGYTPPTIKHSDYQEAFEEMLRLSKKENKTAYVMKVVSSCELIPSIKQFK